MHNHELRWNDMVSIMHACLQTLYLKERTVWCSCRRVSLTSRSLSWDLSGLISHWSGSLSKLSCCFCTCCFSKRKFCKYEMEMLSACHVLRSMMRILLFELWSRSLYRASQLPVLVAIRFAPMALRRPCVFKGRTVSSCPRPFKLVKRLGKAWISFKGQKGSSLMV